MMYSFSTMIRFIVYDNYLIKEIYFIWTKVVDNVLLYLDNIIGLYFLI